MGSYKHSNGRRVFRAGNGRFRKTTLADMGIDDANTQLITFICNVCEREFVPLVLSGKCCGVDNKRVKPADPIPPEQQAVLDQIAELRGRPFISRQILEQIQALERQLSNLKRK